MNPGALSRPELRKVIEEQAAARDFAAASRSIAALLDKVEGTPRP